MYPITRETLPLLVGAAVGTGGVGAALVLANIQSPLRAPFTFFFLVVAPGAALASTLLGLDPLTRIVIAAAGSLVVDLLVAQLLLMLRMWSIRGGVAGVALVSAVLFLLPLVRHGYARTAGKRASASGRTGRAS
ncbi:hypothetical protein K7472_07060 [Streptomyces sp. PTM05]|uniref:Uncharacterized protein n=1 Tax=Streptantibioticus parmotrematis TaxID=2873249 RepID=A0ABS7QN48_9ACTN|nr:hypothetical protein [Streptantibioticus parmotrematis]MBY8884603.1 hypothetical protein [Streptantibioticus parmotrematis]